MIIKYEPNQDNFILTVKYGHRKKYIYIIKKIPFIVIKEYLMVLKRVKEVSDYERIN